MGRHKLHKTAEQIAAQKCRWADTHNRKRRMMYASDPAYRQKVVEQNRSSYRRLNKSKSRDCEKNLRKLHQFGNIRIVAAGTRRQPSLTFSTKELAKALGGYHHIVLYRWQRVRTFPRPAAQSDGLNVYTETQARKLLCVMSKHQKHKQYLHRRDTATIGALFSAMDSEDSES
jgi:hypothetical protein